MVNLLIDGLRHQFQQVPDPRSGGNSQFSFDGIGMAASSVFFVQSPSFLDHQRQFHEAHNRDACQSLFGMRRIPTDNHIRKQLDGITCQSVYPASTWLLSVPILCCMQHKIGNVAELIMLRVFVITLKSN